MEVPNYVMVPVPELLVPRVMEHILALIAADSMMQWDEDAFLEVFETCTEKTKAVLSLTARRALAGKEVTTDMVADALGIPMAEVMMAVRSANEEGFDRRRPPICASRTVDAVLPNGRSVRKRLLEMNERVAKLMQLAEATEREALGPTSPAAE